MPRAACVPNSKSQPALDRQEFSRLQLTLEHADERVRLSTAQSLHVCMCNALDKSPQRGNQSTEPATTLKHVTDLLSHVPPLVVVKGRARQLAMDLSGCRLLQMAIAQGDGHVRAAIAEELRGHVCELVESPNGNFVLQQLIEMMPPSSVCFILHELEGRWHPAFVAKHRFGCRVLERIIEHFPASPGADSTGVSSMFVRFVDGLLANATTLCRHAYGTFVMQHIIEHGSVEQQRSVVSSLQFDLPTAALDLNAVAVLDRALTVPPALDQKGLAAAVLSSEGLLPKMAISRRGLPAAERLVFIASRSEDLRKLAEQQLSCDRGPWARTQTKSIRALLSNLRAAPIGPYCSA